MCPLLALLPAEKLMDGNLDSNTPIQSLHRTLKRVLSDWGATTEDVVVAVSSHPDLKASAGGCVASHCLYFCRHVQGSSIPHAGRLLHASLGGCFAVPPR
jgi:hypothetical protein